MSETEEKKEPTLDELITDRTEELKRLDSSIFITRRLLQSGTIKIVDNTQMPEGQEPPALSVSGQNFISEILSPIYEKLIRDRGSASYDLDRFKAIKENQKA